jgi:LptD protein
VIVQSLSLFSQEPGIGLDSIPAKQDSVVIDTILPKVRSTSSNAIDEQVSFSAVGYRNTSLKNKKVVLIQGAVVHYGEIEISADSIILDMQTNLLFAAGRKDTSGVIMGKPSFKEGAQEFDCDELTYNFKTHQALIKNIITKQDEGLLHSNLTKLLDDGTSNIAKSTYSTCDANPPHFYINLPKARVYPGKKIISGPGNLVIEGVPLPLFIPFGYFPVQTKKAASGILFPRIGEERLRGYSLTEGGYYFAVSDYFDLAIKGNLYSNGTWLGTAQTSYKKLYKYSGSLSFSYANNITGHKGLEDFAKNTNYKLGWTYTQDPKSSPGSRFSASVNMSSSGFDKNNSYSVTEHVTTQKQSSVSYSKSWTGTPFNLSSSMNHSQNVKTGAVNLNLPKLSFNMGRIYPLKSKKSTGPTKWYQELQIQYSSSLDNQIVTNDTSLFTKDVWSDMNNGFKQRIPVSLQIRPFKNFSISPTLTYDGVVYTRKMEKLWSIEDQEVDTLISHGAFYGHAFKPSISASYSPQVFGMFSFTNPDSRIQAIRHVIKPSVGFNYIPFMEGLSSKMYRQVQLDTTGNNFGEYSIFTGGIYGTPSLSSRSGNISLGLVNILEAKVFARNDTTGEAEKVKLIDNFGITTSYNIFADSMRWAPISMSLRTSLFNNFNISASSNFTLYGVDSDGYTTSRFAFEQNKKLLRLNSFTTSLDFSLSDLLQGGKDKKKSDNTDANRDTGLNFDEGANGLKNTPMEQTGPGLTDQYGYSEFDVPWTMMFRYSLNYYKSGLTSNISQTLSFNGKVTLTKKTSITYTSGYDFKGKEITMTQIGIKRDLHCWDMNFRWIPNGTMQGWNFTLRVKASVLGDLKYERRKDYHDNF